MKDQNGQPRTVDEPMAFDHSWWLKIPPPCDVSQRHALVRALLGDAACRQLGLVSLPPGFKISVVIPIYNEERWLETLVKKVQAVELPKEILLINDHSTDGTRTILEKIANEYDNVLVFHQSVNMGKGAALRVGFEKCSGDVVIVQDADLEYDPAEYLRLIQPILDDKADVVFGSRFIGDTHRVLYYWHSVANQCLTMLSNWFTNLNLTDMETCHKVFRREVIKSIRLTSQRFGFEPEITAKVARRKPDGGYWRVYEVPISYSGRTYEEGKKIGLKDAFSALYCIVRYWIAD